MFHHEISLQKTAFLAVSEGYIDSNPKFGKELKGLTRENPLTIFNVGLFTDITILALTTQKFISYELLKEMYSEILLNIYSDRLIPIVNTANLNNLRMHLSLGLSLKTYFDQYTVQNCSVIRPEEFLATGIDNVVGASIHAHLIHTNEIHFWIPNQ